MRIHSAFCRKSCILSGHSTGTIADMSKQSSLSSHQTQICSFSQPWSPQTRGHPSRFPLLCLRLVPSGALPTLLGQYHSNTRFLGPHCLNYISGKGQRKLLPVSSCIIRHPVHSSPQTLPSSTHPVFITRTSYQGFPDDLPGKESARNAGDIGDDRWFPKNPWRRQWHPTPVFLPGKFHGQRSLVGYSLWSCKELDTTEHTHTHNVCSVQ